MNIEESVVSRPKSCEGPPAIFPPSSREAWLQNCFGNIGYEESAEYLKRISDWRGRWRPNPVRFLLVAESHVAEEPEDLSIEVKLPAGFDTVSPPAGFCRLVYCLGYGESEICFPPPKVNSGTWQFWDLFGAIASILDTSVSPVKMPRRRESSLVARLEWKRKVLNVLSGAGVCLEDASIAGLYGVGGKRRVCGPRYDCLVRESFEWFVWPEVGTGGLVPVWVIGRGVGKALAKLPMVDKDHIISQPQDRNQDRYKSDLDRLLASIKFTLIGT